MPANNALTNLLECAIFINERQKKEEKMARAKQYVFSARTTEAKLKVLNEVKSKAGVEWEKFVIEGMCGYYKVDKAIMALAKKETPTQALEKKQPPYKKIR
jgi:hypothetical protein